MTLEKTKKRKALEQMKKVMGDKWTEKMEDELRHEMSLQEELDKAEANEVAILSREAESVLALMERQELFISKFCRECKGIFATNYANVSFCSIHCRKTKLLKEGIVWNRTRPPESRWERYQGDKTPAVPLIVPAEALKAIAHHPIVRKFLEETMLQLVERSPSESSDGDSEEPPKILQAQDQS